MPDQLSVQIARGFGAHGVLPAVVVQLPPALPMPAAAAPPAEAPAASTQGLAAGANAAAVYLGRVDPSPRQDAPALVAALKLAAVLVALGGAYLAGLFMLGMPPTEPELGAAGQSAAAVARSLQPAGAPSGGAEQSLRRSAP